VESQKNSASSLNNFVEPKVTDKFRYRINPEDQATFLSKLSFAWFDRTIFNGYRQSLSLRNIFPPSLSNRVEIIVAKFHQIFERNSNLTTASNWLLLGKFRLIAILIRQFGLEYLSIAAVKLVPTLLTFLSPILLDRLIRFIKNGLCDFHHSINH